MRSKYFPFLCKVQSKKIDISSVVYFDGIGMYNCIICAAYLAFILLQIINELVEESRTCFHLGDRVQRHLQILILTHAERKTERNPYKLMMSNKATIISQNLKQRHFQLIFIINMQASTRHP